MYAQGDEVRRSHREGIIKLLVKLEYPELNVKIMGVSLGRV